MRSNREFHPEWGYLTPTRATMRIALVSAAIGATASAAVVFSLVDGPVAEEQSVAARTLLKRRSVIGTGARSRSALDSHASDHRPTQRSRADRERAPGRGWVQ